MEYHFFDRGGEMPGVTVSKTNPLPDGDFWIDEFTWQDRGYVALGFIREQKFSAKERQEAYRQYLKKRFGK